MPQFSALFVKYFEYHSVNVGCYVKYMFKILDYSLPRYCNTPEGLLEVLFTT